MGVFDSLNSVCMRAFGERYPLRSAGNGADDIAGIFDRRHVDIELEGQPVSVLATTLSVIEADAAGIDRGDEVDAEGATYRVQDVQPDGTGMVVLILEKQ